MSALVYLIRKSIKNSLRELLKKPGKLVLYIILAALMVFVILISIFSRGEANAPAPMFWFTGILFLFVTLFVVTFVVSGLSGGDAIFGMNDVNLLFVSPVGSRKVLLYGLVRMAKTAFAASFFILFQANTLATFGVGVGGLFLTFAGFLLSVVVLTIASLLIYSTTNGRPGRKRLVKGLTLLVFLPLLAFAALQFFALKDPAAAAQAVIESPFLRFVPVAGWTAGGVAAFLTGNTLAGLGFFGLNLLSGTGMITYIMLSNPDYYEDVLVATETAYERKRAVAEGNIDAAAANKRPVKVTVTGIPGSGAAALFGKHMRESFRQSRFGFLSVASVFIVAGAIVLSLITRELFVTLMVLAWMQILFIGTGRGLKETYSHYIYLIPESSMKKILWSNMEIMARVLIESLLTFGISGAVLGAGVLDILACIAVYTLFSFLLLGINYLSMRVTGADIGAGLLIMLYYLAVVLAMLPGLVAALVAGFAIGGDGGFLVGLFVLSAWELAAGLGCFALAKGVLHTCDMAMMKTDKR